MTDILVASTRVKLMGTSCQRLNLYAEQVWPLEAATVLDLPEDVSDGHTPSGGPNPVFSCRKAERGGGNLPGSGDESSACV